MGGKRFALLLVAAYAAVFLLALISGGALGSLLAMAS
jgi:hypothetical protein